MALVDVIIGYAKGAQGDVGPQGPTGPQGPEGPQGPLPPLVNNALATEAGVAALDAAMGKTLQDHIDTTNSNLNTISTDVQSIKTGTIAAGLASNIKDYTYGTPIKISIQSNNLYLNDGNKLYYVTLTAIT